MLIRLMKFGVGALVGAVVGLLLLFAIYGFSQGRDVVSGLVHLIEIAPDPVISNPEIEDVAWQRVSWVADIENRDLSESSGLTASNLRDDMFWSVNDSGHAPEIFAIGMDGRDLGSWQIDAPDIVDWESMDAFMLDGVAYLAIGDTGDNFRWRRSVDIYVVAEPIDLTANTGPIPVAWQVTYRYPDGPRDSEALAVDALGEQMFVLSKRHSPPELFRLPLRGANDVVAEKIALLSHLPKATVLDEEEDENSQYRHMPSGMDLEGERLLLTTYKHAYLYDFGLIENGPRRVRLPTVGQREALSFARGRDDVAYFSRERDGGEGVADLFMIELAPP